MNAGVRLRMIDIFHYGFIQNAVLACFFTVIICAVAGTLVVVNRNVFITGGVAHASYGGIGLALWLGFAPILGALGVALLAGVFLGLLRQKHAEKADALVSAFWAAGMAAGILLSDLTPGYSVDFLSYLFGSILLVSPVDLIVIGAFSLLTLVLVFRYYRVILATSADQAYAATLGIPVKTVNLVLLVLLCVSVVMLMRVAGLIMVMALLSIPAAVVETHTKQLYKMMFLSGAVAFVTIYGGFFISTWLNLTPSAVIVALLALVYMINTVIFGRK